MLSVAIITKDEESCILRCLKSVSFADEIVVVDSGSTDNTVRIAEDFGCRVFVEEWKGFGPQKQIALEHCTGQWVMIVDADEMVGAELEEEIVNAIADERFDGYYIPRRNYFNGKWIRHSGWWPDYTIRLFRRVKGRLDGRTVHESVIVEGKLGKMRSPLVHYPHSGIEDVLRKINDYSSANAEQLFLEGKSSSSLKAILRGLAAFGKSYFLKLGVLDGKEGLVIASSGAVNTFYKYIKLQELHERAEKKEGSG
jgi:glycosyltransferase involved in cell wall biosynthesis